MGEQEDEETHDPDRVPLNLRIHKGIKAAYDDEVIDRFGRKSPYAGTEFEREARAFLDRGGLGELREAAETVADTLDVQRRKKETPERPTAETNEPTTVARYQVHEDLRVKLLEAADEDDRTAGELAGQLMWTYAVAGGITGRVLETLDAVEDELTTRETATSTAEEIAERLDPPFRREEFLDAAKAAGVTTEKYALREYLPDVLEELDVYPHPGAPDRFIERDSDQIPATPDPGTLPYHAMNDADRRLALKAAALRAVESQGEKAAFTVNDAVDALGGHPRHSTVRPLLKEIAEATENNAFQYDDDLPGLKVYAPHVRADEYQHEDALAIVGWLDDTAEDAETDDTGGEDADDPTPSEGGWVGDVIEAVEDLPDPLDELPADAQESILNKEICRHKYSDKYPEADVREVVTQPDRERVRDRLESDVDAHPAVEDDVDEPPSDERSVDTPQSEDDVEDQLDALDLDNPGVTPEHAD